MPKTRVSIKPQLSYPAIIKTFGAHAMSGVSESRAFLAWFLGNYYRLEATEIECCICDGPHDKGIDGLYVNDQLGQIDVLQCRLVQTDKSVGDSGVRDFSGTLSQLRNAQAIENLASKTKNKELAHLLTDQEVAKKVGDGYKVRGIFITNANGDGNAKDFLNDHSEISFFDRNELERAYIPIDKTGPMPGKVDFDISGVPHFEYPIGAEMKMVIAPLSADQLLKMEGIATGELFAWNVRQWLGKKTKVNQDIEESIKKQQDHKYFPAFHNGLTVLCKELDSGTDKITVSGYAVVNGCQSLSSIYENKSDLSSDLRILTKFIKVAPDSELALKITDHTNNQNGTTHRDLQSNNPIQTRLQTEIHRKYTGELFYRIKRGEHPEWEESRVLENEFAARLVLAFDLKDPASCHQTYKLFDELHSAIFGRPQLDAARIVAVHDVFKSVEKYLPNISNRLFARYTQTRYFIMYLVREALETDATGRLFCDNPSGFMHPPKNRQKLSKCLDTVVSAIVRIVDNIAKTRDSGEGFFDYKRELKSPKAIQEMRSSIISQYQIVIDNGYAPKFTEGWAN
jgi:AIPR protein